MRGFRGAGLTIGILIVLAMPLSGCSADGAAPTPGATDPAADRAEVLATVDGHPLVRFEFEQIGEFAGTDGRDAMQAAIRFKVIQLEAQRRGLIDSVDLDDLVAEMDEVNTANTETTLQGGIVYGVSSFDVSTYLARSMSTTRSLLQTAMRDSGELEITEADLRAQYAGDQDALADQPDTVVSDLIRLEGTAEGAQAAADLADALAGGADLASQLQSHDDLVIEATTLEATPYTAYELEKYQTSLYGTVMTLLPGDVAVVADDLGGGIIVLRGTSRSENADKPFAAVEPELRLRAEDRLFERRIDDLVAASDVQIPSPSPAS